MYICLVADIYFASYLKLPQDVIFSLSPLLVLCFGCAFFKELAGLKEGEMEKGLVADLKRNEYGLSR